MAAVGWRSRQRRTFCDAVLGVLLLLFAAAARATDGPASVVQVNGSPRVQRGGQTSDLQVGMTIGVDAVVETDAGAKVKLRLADGSILEIGPQSRLTLREFVLEPRNRRAQLEVLVGRFRLAIAAFVAGPSDYEVRTPTAVAGVRGTVLWGDTDVDAICALEGHVEVRALHGAASPARLETGHCVREMGKGKTSPFTPTPQDLANFLKQVTLD